MGNIKLPSPQADREKRPRSFKGKRRKPRGNSMHNITVSCYMHAPPKLGRGNTQYCLTQAYWGHVEVIVRSEGGRSRPTCCRTDVLNRDPSSQGPGRGQTPCGMGPQTLRGLHTTRGIGQLNSLHNPLR